MRKPSCKAAVLSGFVEEDLAMDGHSCEPFKINRL